MSVCLHIVGNIKLRKLLYPLVRDLTFDLDREAVV